jgi:hypothetical protein
LFNVIKSASQDQSWGTQDDLNAGDEAIVFRAAVPILTLLRDLPPEAVAALAPVVVRIMLAATVEVVADKDETGRLPWAVTLSARTPQQRARKETEQCRR